MPIGGTGALDGEPIRRIQPHVGDDPELPGLLVRLQSGDHAPVDVATQAVAERLHVQRIEFDTALARHLDVLVRTKVPAAVPTEHDDFCHAVVSSNESGCGKVFYCTTQLNAPLSTVMSTRLVPCPLEIRVRNSVL